MKYLGLVEGVEGESRDLQVNTLIIVSWKPNGFNSIYVVKLNEKKIVLLTLPKHHGYE